MLSAGTDAQANAPNARRSPPSYSASKVPMPGHLRVVLEPCLLAVTGQKGPDRGEFAAHLACSKGLLCSCWDGRISRATHVSEQ